MTTQIENSPTPLQRETLVSGNISLTGARPMLWFLSGRMAQGEPNWYVPIHCSPFLIGRQAQTSLSLPCKSVSSVHAEIIDSGKSLVLRDLNSTNGTYVNGERITGPTELQQDDLVQFANMAFRVLQQSSSHDTNTVLEDAMDKAMALVQFDRLMSTEAVVPHYQPIVRLSDGQPIGFEVLARSRIAGMETPANMFSAATELSVETRLSQMVRCKAIVETRSLATPPHLFVNTHPKELEGSTIIESLRAMRELSHAQPITLEIHEKAIADCDVLKGLRVALSDMNIGLAFDDFGAGQARLSELSRVEPDYLKFDISLVHKLDVATETHQQMVASLVTMVQDMGITTLAEGVETEEERDICVDIGFELGQGFFYGKPVSLRHCAASSTPTQ